MANPIQPGISNCQTFVIGASVLIPAALVTIGALGLSYASLGIPFAGSVTMASVGGASFIPWAIAVNNCSGRPRPTAPGPQNVANTPRPQNVATAPGPQNVATAPRPQVGPNNTPGPQGVLPTIPEFSDLPGINRKLKVEASLMHRRNKTHLPQSQSIVMLLRTASFNSSVTEALPDLLRNATLVQKNTTNNTVGVNSPHCTDLLFIKSHDMSIPLKDCLGGQFDVLSSPGHPCFPIKVHETLNLDPNNIQIDLAYETDSQLNEIAAQFKRRYGPEIQGIGVDEIIYGWIDRVLESIQETDANDAPLTNTFVSVLERPQEAYDMFIDKLEQIAHLVTYYLLSTCTVLDENHLIFTHAQRDLALKFGDMDAISKGAVVPNQLMSNQNSDDDPLIMMQAYDLASILRFLSLEQQTAIITGIKETGEIPNLFQKMLDNSQLDTNQKTELTTTLLAGKKIPTPLQEQLNHCIPGSNLELFWNMLRNFKNVSTLILDRFIKPYGSALHKLANPSITYVQGDSNGDNEWNQLMHQHFEFLDSILTPNDIDDRISCYQLAVLQGLSDIERQNLGSSIEEQVTEMRLRTADYLRDNREEFGGNQSTYWSSDENAHLRDSYNCLHHFYGTDGFTDNVGMVATAFALNRTIYLYNGHIPNHRVDSRTGIPLPDDIFNPNGSPNDPIYVCGKHHCDAIKPKSR